MTDNTIDPKKLQEAQQFVSDITNKSADQAKERQVISSLVSKFDKVAQKIRTRTNNMNEIRTYNPNGYVQENVQHNNNGYMQDQRVNEALHTQPIQHPQNPCIMGVQTANFAVFPVPNSDGKTRYEVANLNTQQKLIGELKLNETANAIVKLLNRNYSFYSPEVQSVLKLEESYSKHYNDMLTFKRKNKEQPLEEVHKVRFEDSKSKAIMIKEELTAFNNKLK